MFPSFLFNALLIIPSGVVVGESVDQWGQSLEYDDCGAPGSSWVSRGRGDPIFGVSSCGVGEEDSSAGRPVVIDLTMDDDETVVLDLEVNVLEGPDGLGGRLKR